MAYSRDAFTRDQQETRDRERQYRDMREMADGLPQTIEIASKSQRDGDKPDGLTVD